MIIWGWNRRHLLANSGPFSTPVAVRTARRNTDTNEITLPKLVTSNSSIIAACTAASIASVVTCFVPHKKRHMRVSECLMPMHAFCLWIRCRSTLHSFPFPFYPTCVQLLSECGTKRNRILEFHLQLRTNEVVCSQYLAKPLPQVAP